MSHKFRNTPMDNVKKVIFIASGKGGTGKSTIAANLAVVLARLGKKTALVDADIYGPSIPYMFKIEHSKPEKVMVGAKEMMLPVEKYGLKIMSIAFYSDKNHGLIWHGAMAARVLTKILKKTVWGEIDYMIIDFPSGTGDIQLMCVQHIQESGAIIVTTPKELALIDARKAASMFTHPEANTKILGVIENMSWFTPDHHPDEKYFLFGKDGGKKLAKELNTTLLAQIPFTINIGKETEKAMDIFSQNNKFSLVFEIIAHQLLKEEINQH